MVDATTSSKRNTLPTGIIHADVFAEHHTGIGHPESPLRYRVVMEALRGCDFPERLRWLDPRPAEKAELRWCHTDAYIEVAQRDIQAGLPYLSTGDTSLSERSWDAALHAAGGACTAVDAVMKSEVRNAFCVLRPPGHHAARVRGMGFCIFNNIALAAKYAQQKYGLGKILIADWDVHHGNGTQDIFYEDASVLLFSTHQWPWYPGTGARDETGHGPGLGTTINRPFPAGAGGKEILGAFSEDLRAAAQSFKPELVLISAGFDGRHGDPLGGFQLTDKDFADLTRIVREVADEFADGRVISTLEGGYHLAGLASASTAHCRALAA
jgi:acetoin utilization deacetylase AcuC-like enzyme